MKGINMLLCAILSLAFLAGCSEKGIVLPAEKGEQGQYLDPYLDKLWTQVSANEDGLDIWSICEFIIEASDLEWDQKYLKVALDNLAQEQIREVGHPLLGQIPRFIGGSTDINGFDTNNVEFLLELLCLERMHWYDSLSEDNRTTLNGIIDYAVTALLRDDNIAVTYTNIYLMRTWCLIALGETLPEGSSWGKGSYSTSPERMRELGYELFRKWMAEIRTNGIHEHNSPTYTGVQAECLGYIARYTQNETIRHEAQIALEYFSAMLFANYFTPAMSLGGVQSRCYYKGSSNGKIDNIAGGLIKGYGTYFYNKMALWTPTEQARKINATYPRLVCYRWGKEADMNAVSYYTSKYCIGSTGRPYTGNANEKTMTIFLSGPKYRNPVNIVHYLDGRQDPYGKNKVGTLARHLQKYALGRVQRNNEFIVYISGDGSERGDTKKLQSHVILPSNYIDEVWNGNTRLKNWLSSGSVPLSEEDNKTFFLKFEDVVVSLRYLLVKDIDGKDVRPSLVIDTDGTQTFVNGNAMRITANLSSGTPEKWTRGTVAMWWRADDGIDSDEKFAKLRASVIGAECSISDDPDAVSINVESPGGKLGLNGRLIQRKFPQAVLAVPAAPEADETEFWGFEYGCINGGVQTDGVHFSVNGEDISGPIFSKSNL